MKICIIHSYYADQDRSGENNVVGAQISVLTEIGHEVMVFSNSTVEEQKRRFFHLRAATNVIFGAGVNPQKNLDEFKPDVILMHNLFPNLSTKWLEKYGPITYSFKHNYRDVCASAILYRNKSICLKCIDGSSFNAIKFKCYKNSSVKTAPLAMRNSLNLKYRKDLVYPHKFLVLSNHMKNLLLPSGIDTDKFVVIPNFVEDSYLNLNFNLERNNRWIAAGRLTEEKGFQELIEYWPDKYNLDVYGTGQLLQRLKALAAHKKNVSIKGNLSRDTFVKILPNYTGAVMPSKWYEPGPLVVLEYLAAGLPVISMGAWSEVAGLDEKFHIETTGHNTEYYSVALEDYLFELTENRKIYSELQRNKYLTNYTPEKWHERLLRIISQ